MADKFWMRCGLLVCGVLLAATVPATPVGSPLRREPLHHGVYVAGDHRDTASIQGALVSGRRIARAVAVALA